MTSRRRVGPQVLAVLQHVANHPGCSRQAAAAAAAGIPGYLAGGDHAVQVCIATGLLRACPARAAPGLRLTEEGQAAVAASSEPAAPDKT